MPTATECEALKKRLRELECAYDRAIAGNAEIRIEDTGTGSVTYQAPDLAKLWARIEQLRVRVAECDGSTMAARRAIPIVYGQ